MSVKDIAKLGKLLAQFLAGFACCFARPAGRALLHVYVLGLLSDVQRKNVEAIALDQNVAPRTLQRFLESIVWDEQLLRDRCQQMVAAEHAHPDAIGCIDETGMAKSGNETAGDKLAGMSLSPTGFPTNFPDVTATMRVLDAITLRSLLAKRRRVVRQVLNFAGLLITLA